MAAKVTDVHARRRAWREGTGFKATDARGGGTGDRKKPIDPVENSPVRAKDAASVEIQPIHSNLPPERGPMEGPADRFHKKPVVTEFHDAPPAVEPDPTFDPEAEASVAPARRRGFVWKRDVRFLRRWLRRQSHATIASWIVLALVAVAAGGFAVHAVRSQPRPLHAPVAGGVSVADAISAGDFQKALELTEAQLATKPQDFALRANKAAFLAYLGRLDEAQSLYATLLGEQPGNQGILLNLAETRFTKRDFEGAMPLYQRLITQPRTSEMATFRLYVLHRALGENARAITLSASSTLEAGGAPRLLVNAMEAERRGDATAAAAYREQARSLHPEVTATLEKSIEGIALAPSASRP